jgi:hypothetical protein
VRDLARVARKGTKLYRELRRDIVALVADHRRERKENVHDKRKENNAVREYKTAVRELEQVALKAARSSDGDAYEKLSNAAKRAYLAGNNVMKTGRGLPRFDPKLEMYLLDAFDHARRQWPVIGLVCRSRGYAAGISPGSSFVGR